jgi:hypothetical protein
MLLTPKTTMHTVTLNLMQLVFGTMLAISAGGLGTYYAMTTIAMECRVERPDLLRQSDEAMRGFMRPDAPLPMNQGQRF